MAYTDSFTGTDQTELPTYNANWVKVTTNAQKMEVFSNQCRGVGGGQGGMYLYNQTFASAHYAKAKATLTSGNEGVAVRAATGSGGNGYYCIQSVGDKVYNGELVAGSFTDWDAGLTLPAANSIIELAIDGTTTTTIYYKDDGTTVAT